MLAENGSAKLLAHRGAVPQLLHILAQSSDPQRLANALSLAASQVPAHPAASLDDIRDTIHLVCDACCSRTPEVPVARHQLAIEICVLLLYPTLLGCSTVCTRGRTARACHWNVRGILIAQHRNKIYAGARMDVGQAEEGSTLLVRMTALRILCAWAEASVMNCGKMASMGCGPAMRRILNRTEAGSHELHMTESDSFNIPERTLAGTSAGPDRRAFGYQPISERKSHVLNRSDGGMYVLNSSELGPAKEELQLLVLRVMATIAADCPVRFPLPCLLWVTFGARLFWEGRSGIMRLWLMMVLDVCVGNEEKARFRKNVSPLAWSVDAFLSKERKEAYGRKEVWD